MQPVITTQEYIVLSSLLNTQYLKKNVDYWNILALMTGDRKFPVCEQVLFDSLVCLELGYNRNRRVLGTYSIFHPIRTAALLIRAGGRLTPVDILSALFHDWDEDILPRAGGLDSDNMPEDWSYVKHGLETVVNVLAEPDRKRLGRNIKFLARAEDESYREYITRLVKEGEEYPMIVRIKLADRLDNNLELRLDLPGSLEVRDRYRFVFESLFINLQGNQTHQTPPHKVESEISGDRRFKALYKNILLLSAIRKQALNLDDHADQLFFSLAESSLNEAQHNITHVFDFHLTDTKKKKNVLNKIMKQCDREGIPNASAQSDWQWPKIFCAPDLLTDKKKERKILSRLYQDKTLMAEVAFEFMMIFYLFMYQPDFSLDIM